MEDKFALLEKYLSSAIIELSLIWEDAVLKMSMNNDEWRYGLYFDDPDFPKELHVWQKSLNDSNLVISSLAMFLRNTMSWGVQFCFPK